MKIIPIVYATDKNYLFYTCISITTLAENANKDTFYQIHILVSDDFEDEDNIIKKLQKRYSNIKIIVEKVDSNIFLNSHINNKHISKAAFYRLNVCEYVKADKCIYLDSDTAVTEDLTELFNYNVDNYYLAGCRDVWIDTLNEEELEDRRLKTRIKDFTQYINSGILLFNLKKMREDNIDRMLLEHAGYDYPYEDQDILNVCCYGHILQLPVKWNNFTAAKGRDVELRKSGVSEAIINSFQREEGIYHYITEEARPWNQEFFWRNWYWWEFADKWKDEKAYKKAKQNVNCHKNQMNWKQCINKIGDNKEIVVWGYTMLAKEVSDWIYKLDNQYKICFCDSNIDKQGEDYNGRIVYSPKTIFKEHIDAFFIITSYRGQNEIKKLLQNNNISEDKYYVYCIRKNVDFYRMLDERYYHQELEEVFFKESIVFPKGDMIPILYNNPYLIEKYYMNRWIFKGDKNNEQY